MYPLGTRRLSTEPPTAKPVLQSRLFNMRCSRSQGSEGLGAQRRQVQEERADRPLPVPRLPSQVQRSPHQRHHLEPRELGSSNSFHVFFPVSFCLGLAKP